MTEISPDKMKDLEEQYPDAQNIVEERWEASEANGVQEFLSMDNSVKTPYKNERVYSERFVYDDKNGNGTFEPVTDTILDYYGSTIPEGSVGGSEEIVSIHYKKDPKSFAIRVYDSRSSTLMDRENNNKMKQYLDKRY